MAKAVRKNARFEKIGRVSVQSLCVFQGILLNISLDGCRVRFPAIVNPDTEKDYELTISFSERSEPELLVLLGHIKWVENTDEATEIGFKLFHSPDSKIFAVYIQQLQLKEQESLCLS